MSRTPPTDAELAGAARDYAAARMAHVRAKAAYRGHECEVYEADEQPDGTGYPGSLGVPACHQRRDEVRNLPDDACDECRRAEPMVEAARYAKDRRARALARLERMASRASIEQPRPARQEESDGR